MNRLRTSFIVLPLLLAALLSPSWLRASDEAGQREAAASDLQAANALYAAQDFAGALAAYEKLYRAGFGTREVLGNAGNAAYRAGDVGRAVLHYQRALRVDPDYRQARENLARIQPVTNTPADGGGAELVTGWFRALPGWLWLVLAEGFFLACLGCGVLAVRSRPGTEQRGAWASRTAVNALLAAAAFGGLLLHTHLRHDPGDAVVIQDRAVTRLGPGEEFFEQLELPAGTVVTIKGAPRDGWAQIVLRDGSSGYLRTAALESI